MRILFAIAHYFHAQPGGRGHGSSRDPRPRIQALTTALAALHLHYGPGQGVIRIADRTLRPVNEARAHDLDVLVCTTGGRHLLDRLPLSKDLYTHVALRVEPTALGFACADVLRRRLGIYDWYCFLEDDLVLHDPWFFHKLDWFTGLAGDDCLLQPNRFEAPMRGPWRKVYIDGDLAGRVTEPFQDVNDAGEIRGDCLGRTVTLARTLNPHSGCYFLNARQMETLAARPDLAQPSSEFVGPLESAATLRVMQAFKVYKTAPRDMNFLEIQHAGAAFSTLIGKEVTPPQE